MEVLFLASGILGFHNQGPGPLRGQGFEILQRLLGLNQERCDLGQGLVGGDSEACQPRREDERGEC